MGLTLLMPLLSLTSSHGGLTNTTFIPTMGDHENSRHYLYYILVEVQTWNRRCERHVGDMHDELHLDVKKWENWKEDVE